MEQTEENLNILLKEVHRTLTETELYTCYLANVVRLYKMKDIVTKWIVATASCAPFVAKLQNVSDPTASWLLLLIPLLAILLPILNYARIIDAASSLHGKHAELLPRLQKLWRNILIIPDLSSNASLTPYFDELTHIEEHISSLRSKKLEIPNIQRIKTNCEQTVPKYELSAITNKSGQKPLEDHKGSKVLPH